MKEFILYKDTHRFSQFSLNSLITIIYFSLKSFIVKRFNTNDLTESVTP